MLFVDDKIGFLFGDYTSDEAFENRKFLTDIEATIYKTKMLVKVGHVLF